MKKVSLFLSMLAISLAFVACSPDGNDVGTPKAPELSPVTQEPLSLVIRDSSSPFQSVVFAESGRAIIRLANSSMQAKTRDASEEEGGDQYVIGTYQVNGNTYTVYDEKNSPYCTVELVDKTGSRIAVKIRMKSGSEVDNVEYNGQAEVVEKVASDEITGKLCREWVISSTRLRHRGGVIAGKHFDNPLEAASFNTILQYAKTIATINEDFADDMTVTSIEFTADGTFCIFFANGKHYIGKWSWTNSKNGYLHYSWNDNSMGNKFENGEAVFDVRQYKTVGYYTLTLGAEIEDGGTLYNVELSFFMNEKVNK